MSFHDFETEISRERRPRPLSGQPFMEEAPQRKMSLLELVGLLNLPLASLAAKGGAPAGRAAAMRRSPLYRPPHPDPAHALVGQTLPAKMGQESPMGPGVTRSAKPVPTPRTDELTVAYQRYREGEQTPMSFSQWQDRIEGSMTRFGEGMKTPEAPAPPFERPVGVVPYKDPIERRRPQQKAMRMEEAQALAERMANPYKGFLLGLPDQDKLLFHAQSGNIDAREAIVGRAQHMIRRLAERFESPEAPVTKRPSWARAKVKPSEIGEPSHIGTFLACHAITPASRSMVMVSFAQSRGL